MKKGEQTLLKILDAGVELWRECPSKVTNANIARRVGLTHPSVSNYLKGNVMQMVANHGVAIGDRTVIAQLIIWGSPLVEHLTRDEKLAHLESIV